MESDGRVDSRGVTGMGSDSEINRDMWENASEE